MIARLVGSAILDKGIELVYYFRVVDTEELCAMLGSE